MSNKFPKPIPPDLSSFEVKNEKQESVVFNTFWQDTPALIIFVRHFGCIGCTAQMDAISPRINELCNLGVNLVIIGNGGANFIQGFKDKFQLNDKPVSIYTDPSLKSYKLAEMKRSFWTVFSFRSLADYIRSFSKGIGQSKVQGDNWQQGGALLVDQEGMLHFHFQNKSVAGIADTNDLIAAVQKLMVSQKTE